MRFFRLFQVSLASILICFASSDAQELLFEAFNFNHDVDYLGDIDGDGTDDFAFIAANELMVFSGAGRTPLVGLAGILEAAGYSLTQYSLSLDKRIIVSPLFDINGDGKEEFYVYLPGLHPELSSDNYGVGEFFIVSYDQFVPGGCRILFSKKGVSNQDQQKKYGFDPVSMDDVNRDGVRDFIVRVEERLFNYEQASYCESLQTQMLICSSNPQVLSNCAQIQQNYHLNCSNPQVSGWSSPSSSHLLISGATMAPLRLINDSSLLANAGDINADGYQDIASIKKGSSSIVLNLLSGKDMSFIYSIDLPFAVQAVFSIVSAGDVNADGHGDFAVAPGYPSGFSCSGPPVKVYSGKAGVPLYQFNHPCGTRFTAMGDLDQDEYDDFAIAAPGDSVNGTSSGRINIHSGKSGSVIFSYSGQKHNTHLGYQIDGGGDVNGDGYNDLLALEPFAETLDYDGYKRVGRALVISGDQCLNDPLKISPGQCGCGMVEQGTALDGSPVCTSAIDGKEGALNGISKAISQLLAPKNSADRKDARSIFRMNIKQINKGMRDLPRASRVRAKRILKKLTSRFNKLLRKRNVKSSNLRQLEKLLSTLQDLLFAAK